MLCVDTIQPLMCQRCQRSNLVPIVMRSDPPCELDVVLLLEPPRPGAGVCSGAKFPMYMGAAPDVLFLMKARTLSSKLWGSTCVYVILCFHRSAVGLWGHSHISRFDDGAGFFWRLSSKLSDQLPCHIQQVKRCCSLGRSLQFLELTGNGGCASHILSVKPVGESVPSFSCCLGGVHNLANDTC